MKDKKIVTDADSLLNTDQAAALIGARASTMNVWRQQGRGPRYVKVVGAVRYRLSDLKAYIEANTSSRRSAQ
jgi:predicted DNA-binding transcriptional regulator AlpA